MDDTPETLSDAQVTFLLKRIVGMLTDRHGKVLRAETKYSQTSLDTAARIALIAEANMAEPIRIPTERDLDSRSKFR